MKGNKAHKMALIISLTAFALIAGAMWAVLYVSEGDKDMSTAITMAVLPIVLGGLGYYLLRAWFMKVLPEDNDAESLYGQENEEKPALASLNEDASNGEGLSQIMSQVNDDVAQ